MFHRTHVPLQKWFLILALMLNAKKSVSSCQIARDLGMYQATAWSIMQRIRTAMALDPKQRDLFHGIVEVDETYIGGKPRKSNKVENRVPSPRGKGTSKTPVVGALERGGRVYARMANGSTDLDSIGLGRFIRRFVEKDGTILMTDENPAYRSIGRHMFHAVINHSMAFVEGLVHTNGIEGFWALVKRAWIGQHHHYSEKYMPLYLAEACFKYNHRGQTDTFRNSIAICLGVESN